MNAMHKIYPKDFSLSSPISCDIDNKFSREKLVNGGHELTVSKRLQTRIQEPALRDWLLVVPEGCQRDNVGSVAR